jgi:hypothetical protein
MKWPRGVPDDCSDIDPTNVFPFDIGPADTLSEANMLYTFIEGIGFYVRLNNETLILTVLGFIETDIKN